VISELNEKGVQVWEREWDASTKGELRKTFFPTVKADYLKDCKCA
jgi:hypothetical protein